MSGDGHRATLVVAHQGNTNAARHGLYSGRALAPRGAEIAKALMELPHVTGIDIVAAEEIGSIVARLEPIDGDLDERGHFGRGGARVLLEHKARLSRELRTWLREFGGTPKAKADFARSLSEGGGLAGEIARRRGAVPEP
jgi:hypothetical protein